MWAPSKQALIFHCQKAKINFTGCLQDVKKTVEEKSLTKKPALTTEPEPSSTIQREKVGGLSVASAANEDCPEPTVFDIEKFRESFFKIPEKDKRIEPSKIWEKLTHMEPKAVQGKRNLFHRYNPLHMENLHCWTE